MQRIISGESCYREIGKLLKKLGSKKYMLVCRPSFFKMGLNEYFATVDTKAVYFTDFTVNPKYEEICVGVDLFRREKCDAIVAVGGGSAIDVAKCIKAFVNLPDNEIYFKQNLADNEIPLIAVPTTAGTGSESTRFAVFYYGGEKESLSEEYWIPEYAFLDHTLLYSLPEYQKKCTLLDAFCQAVESWWSVNSNEESIKYAKIAVEKIINNYKAYIFENDPQATAEIMLGSNYAGRAINITATTSAHAMSYKMTTLYGIPHGHAVGIGLAHIWKYMIDNPQNCSDKRGVEYLLKTFEDIAAAMGCNSAAEAVEMYKAILKELDIKGPKATKEELDILASSVNAGRLKNNPVALSEEVLYDLYLKITEG